MNNFRNLFRLKEESDPESGDMRWDSKEVVMCGNDTCFNGLTNQYSPNILSFGEDYQGMCSVADTNSLIDYYLIDDTLID